MGGAYIALSSKQMRTDLAYAWPTAEIAVMGPEGAVNVLYRQAAGQGWPTRAREQATGAGLRDKFHIPYLAADMGQIDEVIEPSSPACAWSMALEILRSKVGEQPAQEARADAGLRRQDAISMMQCNCCQQWPDHDRDWPGAGLRSPGIALRDHTALLDRAFPSASRGQNAAPTWPGSTVLRRRTRGATAATLTPGARPGGRRLSRAPDGQRAAKAARARRQARLRTWPHGTLLGRRRTVPGPAALADPPRREWPERDEKASSMPF